MTAKLGKLTNRKQFQNISARGEKWVTPGFVLQMNVQKSGENDQNQKKQIRIGYTVGRKVGGAVTRNRVKRRLRAVVANVFSCCGRPERDYVLIGRRSAYYRPFKLLVSDMKRALEKLDAHISIPTKRIKD